MANSVRRNLTAKQRRTSRTRLCRRGLGCPR
jgi:hypothetical protein